jgi:hypothetical protein
MTDLHHPTARTVIAEIAEIAEALRERAEARRTQIPACTEAGGHIDALTAKAGECEAMAAFVAAYARFYPDNGEGQP